MMRLSLMALLALAVVVPALPAYAQSVDDPYNIMRPEPKSTKSEPWLAPKYKSPRGTIQNVARPTPPKPPQVGAVAPLPPLYVPQTGNLLPNLPTVSGSGPGGGETGQDRALRCAHQAGVYGQAAGNSNAYVGGCINQ